MPDHPSVEPTRRQRWFQATARNDFRYVKIVAVVAGLLGFALAVAAPFLPVRQSTAELEWPQASTISSVTAPLVSFVPDDLDVTMPCALAAQLPASGGVLVSTVPAGGADATARGLFVTATPSKLTVTNRDVVLLTTDRQTAQQNPNCTLVIRSDGQRTHAELQGLAAARDGEQHRFDTPDPNLRSQVIGIYTDLPSTASTSGVRVHATLDTRFVSTPTTLKFWSLVLGIAMTLVALAALAVLDMRDGRRHRRLLPLGWWRIRPLDALIAAVLIAWWLMGPNTSDDGYNFTVARITSTAGYADNYYRYFGVPQDPFGWHFQMYSLMSKLSVATPWMRLPTLLLGLLGWWLISREVIPRLGRAVRTTPAAFWAAGGVYLAIWLPLNNGLRPEPILAVGALLTWCCVDRAIATGRLLPFATAAIAAAFTPSPAFIYRGGLSTSRT